MAFPTDRQSFTDRCLRKLGYPVLEINVDDDQVADRVDDAVMKYWEFHYDGNQKLYYRYQITANDIANTSITLPTTMTGVTRVFPLYGGFALTNALNMFDIRYQWMLNQLPNLASLSYVDYEITMMHIEQLNFFFNGIPGIRFNKVQHVLNIDIAWSSDVKPGDWIVVEGTMEVDPDTFTDVWKDPWLYKYATAMIKQQWGTNMKKFGAVALMGGVSMNGQQIYDEATAEIAALELELRDTYEEPPQFRMG